MPSDALEVAGVHVRSWQSAYRGLLPDSVLDGLRIEDRAARYTFGVSGPGGPTTVVAVEGDVICGFVTTGASRDEDLPGLGEVYGIYADPSTWGTGVGRGLMERARRHLLEQGFDEALLWVLVGNERAGRFYRADGWVHDGERREHQVGDARADVVRYRRRLP